MNELTNVCEIGITYNPKMKASERPRIANAKDVYDVLHPDWQGLNINESFKVLLMNRRNAILGVYEVSKGGIDGTVVDLRLMFATALKSLSCAIIVAHNHPSGNLQPSKADREITDQIKDAGKLLDVPLLDHLIINEDSYFSFSDEGLI